jgi:hypothetical protein
MTFNAKKHREQSALPNTDGLPVGHYLGLVEEIYDKKSSSGYDMLTFKVRVVDSISGSFINALQWENLCHGHESEMVKQIAADKLAEICLAHGVEEFVDTADLAKQIGFKRVSITINKSRTGKTYAVYRPEKYFFDRRDGVSPLRTAAKAKATELPPQPELMEPPIDFDDDIPF